MKAVIYGIPNCDTIKKARRWLEAQGVDYTFVDFRKTAPIAEQVAGWITAVGQKKLVNRRSTTWKNLPEQERRAVEDGDAISVLVSHPTLIKRPVLEHRGQTVVGFNATDYAQQFNR